VQIERRHVYAESVAKRTPSEAVQLATAETELVPDKVSAVVILGWSRRAVLSFSSHVKFSYLAPKVSPTSVNQQLQFFREWRNLGACDCCSSPDAIDSASAFGGLAALS
jgi:hypothetical protein